MFCRRTRCFVWWKVVIEFYDLAIPRPRTQGCPIELYYYTPTHNNVLRETRRCYKNKSIALNTFTLSNYLILFFWDSIYCCCEAQARVRQGQARDGPYCERP